MCVCVCITYIQQVCCNRSITHSLGVSVCVCERERERERERDMLFCIMYFFKQVHNMTLSLLKLEMGWWEEGQKGTGWGDFHMVPVCVYTYIKSVLYLYKNTCTRIRTQKRCRMQPHTHAQYTYTCYMHAFMIVHKLMCRSVKLSSSVAHDSLQILQQRQRAPHRPETPGHGEEPRAACALYPGPVCPGPQSCGPGST